MPQSGDEQLRRPPAVAREPGAAVRDPAALHHRLDPPGIGRLGACEQGVGALEPGERAVHVVGLQPGFRVLARALPLLDQRPRGDALGAGLLLAQAQFFTQPLPQEPRHFLGEAVAHREHRAGRLLEARALEVRAARPVDEPHRDLITAPLCSLSRRHAAAHDSAHLERPGHAVGRDVRIAVRRDAVWRDHRERGHLPQLGDQRFREAVGEVAEGVALAIVGEVEHREAPRIGPARCHACRPQRPDHDVSPRGRHGDDERHHPPPPEPRTRHTALERRAAHRARRWGRRVQRLCEQRGRGVAVGRHLRQRPQDRRFHGVGDGGAHDGRRGHQVERVARDDGLRRRPGEGRLAHEHLVHDARQAVLVAAAVYVGTARRLLGAHVGRRPDDRAGLSQVLPCPGRRHGARDAEVGDHRAAGREHDVLRLDVAVHDAVAVRVGERARHLGGDPQRVFEGELLFPRQPVAQRLALDERHDVVQETGDRTRIVQRQDVGMLQPRGDLDLPEEALGSQGRGELGVEHLDRHGTVMLHVLGQEDGGHPTAAELALNRVAVGERSAQGVEQIGHGGG